MAAQHTVSRARLLHQYQNVMVVHYLWRMTCLRDRDEFRHDCAAVASEDTIMSFCVLHLASAMTCRRIVVESGPLGSGKLSP